MIDFRSNAKAIIFGVILCSLLVIGREIYSRYLFIEAADYEKKNDFAKTIRNYKILHLINFEKPDSSTGHLLSGLARRMWEKGFKLQALKIQGESVERIVKLHGGDNWRSLQAISDLGWYHYNLGDYKQARPLVELAFKKTKPTDVMYFYHAPRMAKLYHKIGDDPKAEALTRKLISISDRQNDKSSKAIYLMDLSELLREQGHTKESATISRLASDLISEVIDKNKISNANTAGSFIK